MKDSSTRQFDVLLGIIIVAIVGIAITAVVHIHNCANPTVFHATSLGHHTIQDEVTVDLTMVIVNNSDTSYVVTANEHGTLYSTTNADPDMAAADFILAIDEQIASLKANNMLDTINYDNH